MGAPALASAIYEAIVDSLTGGAALATLSYVLLIGSMLMSRITYLRLLAIASGITGVIYFWVFLGDRVASVWEMLFILANLFQLALTAYRDRMSRFGPDEMIFRTTAVPGLSPSQARRLLSIADLIDAEPGATITRQAEAVPALAFILTGAVDIRVGSQIVARCGPTDFVGEIGVMNNAEATATAEVATPVRYFAFDALRLRRLIAHDKHIGHELELAFRHGLRQKLMRANTALAEHQAAALAP